MEPCQRPVYAGVDAGGSRSRCALVDSKGNLVAVSTGEPGAYHPHAPEAGASAVRACVLDALKLAGAQEPMAGLGLGVAGVGRPGDHHAYLQALAPGDLAQYVSLATDAEAALWGAFPAGVGIVVIAGTGSVAYGRDARGFDATAGGWGREIDDEGGAFWLGREALRAVARAADGRNAETALVAALAAQTGCSCPRDLVTWVRDPDRSPRDIAKLSACVDGVAAQGDTVAQGLLADAGRALAELAAACAARLSSHEVRRTALMGGLAARSAALREAFTQCLAELSPAVALTAPALPPVFGAIVKLCADMGIGTSEALLDRLRDQARFLPPEWGYGSNKRSAERTCGSED